MTQEEVENENLMGHVEDHIRLELVANANATVDQLASSLLRVMRRNINRTRRMRYNNREIEPFTPLARSMSYMHILSDAAAAMQGALRDRGREDNSDEEDLRVITTADITDLDEVQQPTVERLVRRSLARTGRVALESSDVEMQ